MTLENTGPVALIGAGKMGLALARGWLASGLRPKHLLLIDPNPNETTRAFADENGVTLSPSLSGLIPDVLVLAVKPQIMPSVLAEVEPAIGPQTLVISIAAGIPIAKLQQGLGTDRVIRVMPNTPAQVGQGISGAVAGFEASPADMALTDSLLQAAGQVLWFDDEAKIDGVTAVSGSGPAYVFYLVEALAEAARNQGFDEKQAMQLARQTVIGAAALMQADPLPASTLRENVTSPKGTTAAALEVLMADDGLRPLLDKAVKAARLRSEELGRG